MTDTLEALEALLAAAMTPHKGKWETYSDIYGNHKIGSMSEEGRYRRVGRARDFEDAALIVAAVNALPGLIAEVKRLREALEPFAVEYREQERFWPEKARVVAWAPFREAYRITIDDLRAARRARGEP